MPASDGGCPITGYEIYRNDGLGGDLTIPVDASDVANKPDYFSHVASTLSSTLTGTQLKVKVVARNVEGTTETDAL